MIHQNPTILLSDTSSVLKGWAGHRAKLNRVWNRKPIIGEITLHAASQACCKILVGVNAQASISNRHYIKCEGCEQWADVRNVACENISEVIKAYDKRGVIRAVRATLVSLQEFFWITTPITKPDITPAVCAIMFDSYLALHNFLANAKQNIKKGQNHELDGCF